MKRIIKRSEDEIKLELEKYKNEPEERPLTAHIKKTGTKDVYKLRINFGDRVSTIFVTPIRSIRGFDVLINHCPINKVVEFDGFYHECCGIINLATKNVFRKII